MLYQAVISTNGNESYLIVRLGNLDLNNVSSNSILDITVNRESSIFRDLLSFGAENRVYRIDVASKHLVQFTLHSYDCIFMLSFMSLYNLLNHAKLISTRDVVARLLKTSILTP